MLVSCCLLLRVLVVFQQHRGDGGVRAFLLQKVSENSWKNKRRMKFKIIVNGGNAWIGTCRKTEICGTNRTQNTYATASLAWMF